MARINRTFLDPALGTVNAHAALLLDQSKSVNQRMIAEADATLVRAKSEFEFRKNVSRGLMIGIVLIAFGIFCFLLALAIQRMNYAPNLVGRAASVVPTAQSVEDVPPMTDEQEKILANTSAQEAVRETPAVIVPAQEKDVKSNNCANNTSFIEECVDNVTLPNGATYTGTWLNGNANGKGSIEFTDGGSLYGHWENGYLIEIIQVEAPDLTANINSSVILFTETPGQQINSAFGQILSGHEFESIKDPNWSRAFCYVTVAYGRDTIRVELSFIESFNEKVDKLAYQPTERFSKSEFEAAQNLCPYRYSNF